MQLDNNSLQKILSMNDSELKKVVSVAASEGGVSIPSISESDIAKLRAALSGVSSDPKIMEEILKSAPKK